MSRHLLLLGLVAVPALALTACDRQSPLAKAKPGECYSVVGRNSMGEPELAKTACPGSPAALAAACPTPAPGAPGAACPTTAAATETKAPLTTTGAATVHKASSRATSTASPQRRVVRVSQRSQAGGRASHSSRDYTVARSGEVRSLGLDYARVDQDLAGGPSHYSGGYQRHDYAGGEQYARHGQYARGEQYARHGEYARGDQHLRQEKFGRREQYGHIEHGPPPPPPPPPPPVHYSSRGATIQYSERSRQSQAYRESYSSSSSSSSRGSYGRVDCDCEGGVRSLPPRSPFDEQGFLTWRGKTPG